MPGGRHHAPGILRAVTPADTLERATYGVAGKPEALNELDRQLNSIADRQLHDPKGLENLVRQTYSQQCSH